MSHDAKADIWEKKRHYEYKNLDEALHSWMVIDGQV